MSNYVHDLWPGSPQEKASPAGRSSRLSSSRSSSRPSSRSSRAASSASSRSSSRSRSRPRRRSSSRSRSRCRRRHQRKYRRYSRSYSRSRSRSRGRRHRDRQRGPHRRYSRSPPRCRSRSGSRSRGRCYRRAAALTRGRRYYGFGRTGYPEEHRGWRARARTRSRSRTPLRLSEKDRMELLEIAKANAAKALGTANLDLPASLRTVAVAKETNRGATVPNDDAKFELSEKLREDGPKNRNEKSFQQRSIAFSSNNSVAKPVFQKPAKATMEDTSSGSPKVDEKRSPYGLWVPV